MNDCIGMNGIIITPEETHKNNVVGKDLSQNEHFWGFFHVTRVRSISDYLKALF